MQRRQVRRIQQAIDLKNLAVISAVAILNPNIGRAVRARADQQKKSDQPFVCKLCQNIVIVPMHPHTREYYFKHWHQNVDCPWTSESSLSVDTVNSMIFGGRQEGPLHKRIVDKAADLLSRSEGVENVWKDQRFISPTTGEWKKPDLRFTYKGQMFVFEVQLATTQRPIITERNSFYLKEKIPIVWVTWSPPPVGLLEHKASVIDIITDHNDNLFSLDEATLAQTSNQGIFCLRVHWWDGNHCHDKIITLDDLVVHDDKLPYAVEKPLPWYDALKNEWALLGKGQHISNTDIDKLWFTLMAKTEWPNALDQPELDWDVVSLIDLLISLERRLVVNSKQGNLVEILHTFLTTQSRKPMAKIVEYAVKKAGHSELLKRPKTSEILAKAKLVNQISKDAFAARMVRQLFPHWV